MVMMWRASRRLISLTSAASVVVLPDPVGPPTRTRPRGRRVSASTLGGRFEGAKRGTVDGSRRIAAAGAAALVMQVDAEAAEVGRPERAVGDADVAIRLARVRRQRRHDRVRDFLAAERRLVERRHDAPSIADRRRRAGHEQQIAGGPFDDLLEPAAQPRGLARPGRRGSRTARGRGAPRSAR